MKRALLATMFVLASAALAYGQAGDEPKTSNRVVVDRVELQPSQLTGYNLRVYLSALTLQGTQLDLTDGPLSGKYTATSLLDNSKINALQANVSGGFAAYKPVTEIPPYGVIIIQLTPTK